MAGKYGDQASKFLDLILENDRWIERIHLDYPFVLAEAVYGIRFEMAVTLRDFYARRIRFELLDWDAVLESLPRVSAVFAQEFEWDEKKRVSEVAEYQSLIEKFKTRAKI